MRVIVDAFRGDNAPLEIIKGAAEAAAEYKVEISLVGREAEIRRTADKVYRIIEERLRRELRRSGR